MPAMEGSSRGRGGPLSETQRAARHFGISEADATLKLATGEITLPSRGSGLLSNPKLPFALELIGGIMVTLGTLIFIWQRFKKT